MSFVDTKKQKKTTHTQVYRVAAQLNICFVFKFTVSWFDRKTVEYVINRLFLNHQNICIYGYFAFLISTRIGKLYEKDYLKIIFSSHENRVKKIHLSEYTSYKISLKACPVGVACPVSIYIPAPPPLSWQEITNNCRMTSICCVCSLLVRSARLPTTQCNHTEPIFRSVASSSSGL